LVGGEVGGVSSATGKNIAGGGGWVKNGIPPKGSNGSVG